MRRARSGALTALIGLVLAGSAHGEEIRLARVSFGEGWDALPALVAVERGFFAEQGIVASPLGVDSAEAVINSLAGGSSDFAVVPQRTLLVMAAAKVPVSIVALAGWNTRVDLVVREAAGIQTLAGLRGKRIAVGRGESAHSVLMRLLNVEGLGPGDVRIEMRPPDALAQAFQGEAPVDAVCASGHYTERLVGSGGRVLLPHAGIVEKIGYVGAIPLVASNKTLETSPDLARRFVAAWIRALDHIRDDPADAARILQIFFHRAGVRIGEEQALAWVGMTRWDRHAWSDADTKDAEFNGWGLVEGGVLKVQPKLAGYANGAFLPQTTSAR